MLGRLAFIVALLGAAPALAHSVLPAPPQVSATPEEMAAARTEADAIIERSQAGAFFENLTTTETPQARHRPSGMICSFTRGDARNTIAFYPVVEGGPQNGDDVSCGTWWGTTYVTSYATRYPQQYSADQLFAAAVRDIRENWQNVVAMEGSVQGATIEGQEPPLVAAFTADRAGRSGTTALVLRNIGEWSFKVRATGEPNDPDVTIAATLAFGAALPGGWEIIRGGR